jgi:ribosomal protein L37AE/L43A
MNHTCPNCQSTEVTYRSKKQCYICENCDTEFVPDTKFTALRVFISYGHDEHVAFAQKLANETREKGHEVWFDLERLKPGGDWEAYIQNS